MTDLEITRLCAEAMGRHLYWDGETAMLSPVIDGKERNERYNPLHDDAQAMALVKRFNVKLTKTPKYETWRTVAYSEDNYFLSATTNQDLNRAICETIAKMQQEKAHSSPA